MLAREKKKIMYGVQYHHLRQYLWMKWTVRLRALLGFFRLSINILLKVKNLESISNLSYYFHLIYQCSFHNQVNIIVFLNTFNKMFF